MAIRTRFAPSPTGPLHIGGVRTALFSYLFARQNQGEFVIRIEDTDQERSKKEYEKEILDSFRWLGLTWDGEIARQSERLKRYQEVAESLVAKGVAYWSETEGRKAIKLKIPTETIKFDDLVHGPIGFKGSELGDLVILKSDGFPTYHLASVVDDHEMGITHVIRGDDHISNTPRHVALYQALEWKPPAFAHLPLVFGADRTPLSKRHGDVSLTRYRDLGFLPDALLNYLALLGWSPGGDRELFSRQELETEFKLEQVHKTSACFDPEKLKWLNREHVKRLPEQTYVELAKQSLGEGATCHPRFNEIALLYRERVSVFSDLTDQVSYYFSNEVTFDPKAVKKHFKNEETQKHLKVWREVLAEKGDFSNVEKLEQLLRQTSERLGISAGKLIHPTRVAVSGRSVTPSLFDVVKLLGREVVLKRLDYVIMHFQDLKNVESKA